MCWVIEHVLVFVFADLIFSFPSRQLHEEEDHNSLLNAQAYHHVWHMECVNKCWSNMFFLFPLSVCLSFFSFFSSLSQFFLLFSLLSLTFFLPLTHSFFLPSIHNANSWGPRFLLLLFLTWCLAQGPVNNHSPEALFSIYRGKHLGEL